MVDPVLVDFIHAVAFGSFWLLLLVGFATTFARVAYYRANNAERPRLLTRDALVVGGFSVTFGLILFARVLNATNLRDNVLWALATDVPAITAVLVYAYYELFVIERPKR